MARYWSGVVEKECEGNTVTLTKLSLEKGLSCLRYDLLELVRIVDAFSGLLRSDRCRVRVDVGVGYVWEIPDEFKLGKLEEGYSDVVMFE